MPTFVPAGGFSAEAAKREEARNEALELAKAEFFEKQRRFRGAERRKAASGEGSWVVPVVAQRLETKVSPSGLRSPIGQGEPASESSDPKRKRKEKKTKSHKDGKKGKKNKKDKKRKSEKKRESKRARKEGKPVAADADDSSESDSETDDEVWVEKGASLPTESAGTSGRDDWMLHGDVDPFAAIMAASTSSADRKPKGEDAKAAAAKERAEDKAKQLGQSARELNPYWKDGGTGAPPPRHDAETRTGAVGWRARIKQRGSGVHGRAPSSPPRQFELGPDESESRATDLRAKMRSVTDSSIDSHHTVHNKGNCREISRSFLGDTSAAASAAPHPPDIVTPGVLASEALHPSSIGPPLTEEELNTMAADLMRAEMMGDDEEVVELKAKLDAARSRLTTVKGNVESLGARAVTAPQDGEGSNDIRAEVLMRVNRAGMAMPMQGRRVERERQALTGRIRRVAEKADTHEDGERARYFADDDQNADIRAMAERERLGLDDDPDAVFRKYHSKFLDKTDDDEYTMDDMYVDRIGRKQAAGKQEARDRSRAIAEQQRRNAAMDRDEWLFENFFKANKHLVASLGRKVYMALPPRGSLTEGHVLLIPVRHVTACTTLDEDEWTELQRFKQCLVAMWKAEGKDTIFMETVMGLRRQIHTVVHCVPLEGEEAEFAPMYFKKAIQDSDEQWSQHKKVIDTRAKGLRRSVPQGFPYFSVEFGMDNGFAHVIEDEAQFPRYFGQEIIGSILGLTPSTWLKPPREKFEVQKQKALTFTEKWSRWDWTVTLDE